jgi:hypothetical protein
MPNIRNLSAGPRFFNVAGGAQRLLAPGETANLDLLVPFDEDKGLQAMRDRGEIALVSDESAASANATTLFNPEALRHAQQRLVDAQNEVDRLLGARAAADLDAARRTPPHQFASDGGPAQVATVDGTGGAPTPNQGGGTPEQRIEANAALAGTDAAPPATPAPAAAPAPAPAPAAPAAATTTARLTDKDGDGKADAATAKRGKA